MRIARGSSSATSAEVTGEPGSPSESTARRSATGSVRSNQSSCGSSNGVASRPPSTMSKRKPSAQSGSVSVEVERADEPLAARRIGDRVEDRVELEQRVAGEVHLRDEPLRNARPNSEKWTCAGRHAFAGCATGTRPASW